MNFIQSKLKQNNVFVRSVELEVPNDAGSQLFGRFQNDWTQISANSLKCANKAKEVTYFLKKTAADIKTAEENLNRFHCQIQTIPSILKQADEVILALEKLETKVIEVSCALDFYEKISNEHTLCNQKQAAIREINELRIAKREELEKEKEQLAKKHSLHLARIKSQQENLAAERQKRLLDAISISET